MGRDWLPRWLAWLITPENLVAVALCLLLIALLIVTADTAPQWIYQGF
jgi:hypothetical protein